MTSAEKVYKAFLISHLLTFWSCLISNISANFCSIFKSNTSFEICRTRAFLNYPYFPYKSNYGLNKGAISQKISLVFKENYVEGCHSSGGAPN